RPPAGRPSAGRSRVPRGRPSCRRTAPTGPTRSRKGRVVRWRSRRNGTALSPGTSKDGHPVTQHDGSHTPSDEEHPLAEPEPARVASKPFDHARVEAAVRELLAA